MSRLLTFFGSNLGVYVIAAVVLALIAFGTAQTLRLSSSEIALAKEQVTSANLRSDAAEYRARVASLTKEASENARKVEAEKAVKAQEIVHAVAVEKSNTAAAVAAHRADVRGLREQLASYASGTSGASEDAGLGLSASEKAARLGDVLATCADTSLSDAAELEDLASQVRGLQGYWSLTGDHP